MAQFKGLFQNVPGGTMKNQKKLVNIVFYVPRFEPRTLVVGKA